MSNSLLVGIDVSLKDNKVRILHPDGTSLAKFVVLNSVPGANTLSKKLHNSLKKQL
ncbi:IS110 family transposase [Acetivibrio cellulolyticus]|uniref:IS110 family transposase n=1 Tax=Acetivibrio cellulolyticus TaxID=35830 RepID=UPI001F46B1B5|nr:IS110 family transposase [Acetivibrio cellulolyticus]